MGSSDTLGTKRVIVAMVIVGLVAGVGATFVLDGGGIESSEELDGAQSDEEFGGGAGNAAPDDSDEQSTGSGDDANTGDTGDGGSGDENASSGDSSEEDSSGSAESGPGLEFDILGLEPCGLTCRDASSRLVNTGDEAARDITAEVTVLSGGEELLQDTIDVGTLEPGEEEARSTQIDIGTTNGLTVRDNGGNITIETAMIHEDGTDEFVHERNVFITDSEGDTVDGDFELEFERFENCGRTCRETTTTIENNGNADAEIDHVDVTVSAGGSLIFEETIEESDGGSTVPAGDSHTDVREFTVGPTDALTIADNGGFLTIEITYNFRDGTTAEFRTQRNVFL